MPRCAPYETEERQHPTSGCAIEQVLSGKDVRNIWMSQIEIPWSAKWCVEPDRRSSN
jgi:hypothetical protein